MSHIVYVGNFGWPDENAAGKRVICNAKLIQLAGYSPVLIGRCTSPVKSRKIVDTYRKYEDIECFCFPWEYAGIKRYNYRAIFNSLCEFISSKYKMKDIKAFVYYGTPSLSLFNDVLISYAHRNGIPIIGDVVDWFTTRTANIGFNMIKNIDVYHQMHHVNRKADGLIVISSFLKEYYKKTVKHIVIIPPLDISHENLEIQDRKENNLVRLLYAGVPFRIGHVVKNVSQVKDRLDIAILGVCKANKKGCNYKLTICGLTKKEFLGGFPYCADAISQLGSSIEFMGKIPNSEVYRNTDKIQYSIILRDVNRMSSAGFSTKISESISMGIPVITTKTSDIDMYLRSNKLCRFVDIADMDVLASQLERIYYDYLNNKQDILVVNNPFYYKKYLTDIVEIINDSSAACLYKR